MNSTQYRSQNFGRRNGNSFGRKPNHFRGFRGTPKKLDPRLFINKAIGEKVTEEYVSKVKFSEFNLVEKIKRNIEEHGYTTPTAIQEQTIPQIIEGRDIIGIANTGTGKTAAFLISLINKSVMDRNQRVLIVVPTRELAIQIGDEFKIFAKGTDLEMVNIIGGSNIKRQSYALMHNPHFVIGTPGRLKDLINRRKINLQRFQNIVLDEVDRMLDFGFIHDIKFILSYLPKIRQSLFFSATIDKRTDSILKEFVSDPVTISVKKSATSENVDQDIVKIPPHVSKVDILHDLLIKPEFEKVIVFGRTKHGMNKLSRDLEQRGFRTAAIHGNKSQNQRQKALADFKNHRLNILIATDLASRGIDVEDITHVINYDAPTTYDDYIHRIGRTGRAGKKGFALTFVD